MFTVDRYTPTRIVFGAGRLKELAELSLPGKKALLCVIGGSNVQRSGLQDKVIDLLQKNEVTAVVYDHIAPNPTKKSVMDGAQVALAHQCDFVLGLGGGSSIDAAKAIAVMMKNPGDLWDYGYTGTGGEKLIVGAAPIVAVTTTCGTGTENDQYCVITNEETGEKLDFTADAIFPTVSVIDPELMLTIPRDLTIYQGFDALFHAAECYVTNGHQDRMVDLYAVESVKTVARHLPTVVKDPGDLAARSEMAYAADILSGYTMALISVTSHHILAQALGGYFPKLPHGASLILVCEAYYTKVCSYLPLEFDELGELMGEKRDPKRPGYAFVQALIRLMEETGCRDLAMSSFGIERADFSRIAKMTVDEVGISMDRYTLTREDMIQILEDSYK